MSQAILRVRPTKIELIRLKRRLALAKRVHKILRERLMILISEYLNNLKIAIKLRNQVKEKLTELYTISNIAFSIHGIDELESLSKLTMQPFEIITGTQSIIGVRTAYLEFRSKFKVQEKPLPLISTTIAVEELRQKALKLIEDLSELAEKEKLLDLLGREIARTKRRVNVLEYMFIPKLQATIKYLQMKFEEREREEKTRLKRVKVVLSRRRA